MTLVILVLALTACYALPIWMMLRKGKEPELIDGMKPTEYAHYGRTLEQIRNAPEYEPGPVAWR